MFNHTQKTVSESIAKQSKKSKLETDLNLKYFEKYSQFTK